MMQAYCHYYLKDYQKAYDAFCELTEMYPGNVVSIFFSALSLCGQKRYAEALRYFEDLQLSGELTTAEALIVDINRALIYDTAGNKDGAKMMMEKLFQWLNIKFQMDLLN
jgi:tetratricopeptide (TPR) repeat protein